MASAPVARVPSVIVPIVAGGLSGALTQPGAGPESGVRRAAAGGVAPLGVLVDGQAEMASASTLAGSGGAPSGRGRQMSVFTVDLANQPGELARLCEAMAGRGINLVLSAIARENGGTVAFIADDEAGAQEVLDGAGLQYAMRPALTIRMENQPGTGAATFRKLANAGVNADLLLPVRVSDALFFAVICVDDQDKARQALGPQVIPPGPRPVALAAVPGLGPASPGAVTTDATVTAAPLVSRTSRRDRLSSRPRARVKA